MNFILSLIIVNAFFLLTRNILLGYLILWSNILIAQNEHDSIADFNQDGFIDSLHWHYDGGSGFGGLYCTVINGKTNEKFEIDNWGCFCEIKRVIPLPSNLAKKENFPFLELIKAEIMPPHKDEADPSLQWIMTATNNKNDSLIHRSFNQKILVRPNWIKGEITTPENYHIDIQGKELDQFYHSEGDKPDWYEKENMTGWLSYYGLNHFSYFNQDTSLYLADSSRFYKIYSTKHGIAVKRKDDHAWLFVSDIFVTGGPEKLRWPSIGKIVLKEHYIFLQHKLTPSGVDQLYIIDIESGLCVRMNELIDGDSEFTIEKDELSYLTDNLPNKYSISELFKQMKLLNK